MGKIICQQQGTKINIILELLFQFVVFMYSYYYINTVNK